MPYHIMRYLNVKITHFKKPLPLPCPLLPTECFLCCLGAQDRVPLPRLLPTRKGACQVGSPPRHSYIASATTQAGSAPTECAARLASTCYCCPCVPDLDRVVRHPRGGITPTWDVLHCESCIVTYYMYRKYMYTDK